VLIGFEYIIQRSFRILKILKINIWQNFGNSCFYIIGYSTNDKDVCYYVIIKKNKYLHTYNTYILL